VFNLLKHGPGTGTMRLQLEAPPKPPSQFKDRGHPPAPVPGKWPFIVAGGSTNGKIWIVLGLIILSIGAFCLRFLPNNNHSAYMDEVSQILAGRYLIESGTIYANILTWSYGSYLWPVIAGSMDIIGGLGLVRTFTALCGVIMTLATVVSAYRLSSHVLPIQRRWAVAFVAGLVMAIFPTALGIGSFGTYDALAGAAFMSGIAVLFPVEGTAQRTRLVSAFLLFFIAFLAKYVIAIFFPVICLYLMLSAGSIRKLIERISWFIGPLTAICALYFLLFRSELTALLSFSHTYTDLKSQDPFLVYVWERPEIWLLVVIASIGWERATRQMKMVALGGSGVILGFQLIYRADFDFWKHSIYLLFFLAPLAGLALVIPVSRVYWHARASNQLSRSGARVRLMGLSAVILVVFSASLLMSLSQANLLVNFYPNLSIALPTIKQNVTGVHKVLTDDLALRYYLYPDISTDQVTDPFYVEYYGKTGMDGYRASIADRHYDVIILDGGIGPIGKQLSRNLTGLIKQHYNLVASEPGLNGTSIDIYKPHQCILTTPAANSKVFNFASGTQGWGGHPSEGEFQAGSQVSISQAQTCNKQSSLKFTPTAESYQVGVRLGQPGGQPVSSIKTQIYIETTTDNSGNNVIGMAAFDQNWQWHDDGFKHSVPTGRWMEISWQLPNPGIYNEIDLVFPKEATTVYISQVEVQP
jgi:hypothetical protein